MSTKAKAKSVLKELRGGRCTKENREILEAYVAASEIPKTLQFCLTDESCVDAIYIGGSLKMNQDTIYFSEARQCVDNGKAYRIEFVDVKDFGPEDPPGQFSGEWPKKFSELEVV